MQMTKPYVCVKTLDSISYARAIDTNAAIKCLKNNKMVANASKFKFMFLSKQKNLEKSMIFDGNIIKSSNTVELLGISLNRNISFKRHVEKICCKANTKTKSLFFSEKFLNIDQAQMLAKAYILSSFRYRPLVWMSWGKMNNRLIVKTHYRTLRVQR